MKKADCTVHSKPVTALLIGAGTRGWEVYGKYALDHPDGLKFIAVAEPDESRRKRFQREHSIPDSLAFNSWQDVLTSDKGRIADMCFVCTQDAYHFAPATKAIELGYHLLLEKPISPNIDECRKLEQLAREKGVYVQVSHVLRYTTFWQKIKSIVDSGKIGKVVMYDHSENVSHWHFGHSFVRGSYSNKDTSSPVVLAKTCHDLDLMQWIIGEKAVSVQSKGELTFYKPENAPKGAPDRCTDGCSAADTCPWYAPRTYIDADPVIRIGLHSSSRIMRKLTKLLLNKKDLLTFFARFIPPLRQYTDWRMFPTSHITTDFTYESKMKALRKGPFGRCVFKCGNDVMDHQVSTFTFPSGALGTLTVHGVSDIEGREIRIFGTKGAIRGNFRDNGQQITVNDFRYSHTKVVHKAGLSMGGHGGGDYGLADYLVGVVSKLEEADENVNQDITGKTDISGAMESHYMAFAAEHARISRNTEYIEYYRKSNSTELKRKDN